MKRVIFGLLGIVVVVASGIALANHSNNNAVVATDRGETFLVAADDDHVAVKGYDVVAYFTNSEATPGDARYAAQWHGAKWHFASAENKARFEANPEAYAPQYGGFCAWGVAAQNDLFEINPKAWKIVDGKLYLNFNKDIQQKWLADIPGFIDAAEENWPHLVKSRTQ